MFVEMNRGEVSKGRIVVNVQIHQNNRWNKSFVELKFMYEWKKKQNNVNMQSIVVYFTINRIFKSDVNYIYLLGAERAQQRFYKQTGETIIKCSTTRLIVKWNL